MASTTSSPGGFLSSQRTQQWLLWISGAVLVIGVAVFLGVFLTRGTGQPASADISTVSSPPAHTTQAQSQKKVAPSPAALAVARRFLQTAVLGKDPATAYALVGPALKAGESLAQWRNANPVTTYPARNADDTQFVVQWSHPDQLMLQVVLNARRGSHVRPSLAFSLGVDRFGGANGKPARWLVNYWMPQYSVPIHSNPYG